MAEENTQYFELIKAFDILAARLGGEIVDMSETSQERVFNVALHLNDEDAVFNFLLEIVGMAFVDTDDCEDGSALFCMQVLPNLVYEIKDVFPVLRVNSLKQALRETLMYRTTRNGVSFAPGNFTLHFNKVWFQIHRDAQNMADVLEKCIQTIQTDFEQKCQKMLDKAKGK